MLFHISTERMDSLWSQAFFVKTFDKDTDYKTLSKVLTEHPFKYQLGDNEYHLIDQECAKCPVCGIMADSIPVSSAVELEEYKIKVGAS